jgi:hypothetical protein
MSDMDLVERWIMPVLLMMALIAISAPYWVEDVMRIIGLHEIWRTVMGPPI